MKKRIIKKNRVIVLLIALICIVVIGVAYYFVNKKQNLNNQILNLENQSVGLDSGVVAEGDNNKKPQPTSNTKDNQGNDILYQANGKSLSYKKEGWYLTYYKYNFYINNELLTWRYGNKTAVSSAVSDQMNKTDVYGKNFKIYKTNQDNVVVVYHESFEGAMGGDFSISAWSAINLSKSLVLSLYSYDDVYLDFGDNKSEVIDIADNVDEKECNEAKNATEAKNISPLFKGFLTYYEKVYYEESDSNATLLCSFGTAYDDGGNKHNQVVNTNKTFLGFDNQLTKVYFLVKGNGWEANYSYNFETKKITKENPSSMLKLTLSKDF